MRNRTIPLKKVQWAFSKAIKRRDGRCMVKDFDSCSGNLECSHFFTQGGSPSLMFYPPNAYAQCSNHHWRHHSQKEKFYEEFMQSNHSAELEYMARAKNKFIKYTDELKSKIISLCDADKLDELKTLIEENLK